MKVKGLYTIANIIQLYFIIKIQKAIKYLYIAYYASTRKAISINLLIINCPFFCLANIYILKSRAQILLKLK